jgi:7-carboxy-7-deazaguanine synthase
MPEAPPSTATYAVNDIRFTIYGEGVHIGKPAVVVELQGCSVGCDFCECKKAWSANPANETGNPAEMHRVPEKWMTLSPELIGGYALELLPDTMKAETWAKIVARKSLAVVTGGEPAEQDLQPLARHLRANGFFTVIETSGTAAGFFEQWPSEVETPHVGYPAIVKRWTPKTYFDYVVVSPKIDQAGGKELNADACSLADEVRMIVRKPSDLPLLSAYLQNFPPKQDAEIFLQPVNRSEYTVALAVDAAKRRGWRLSVQINKLLDIA